MAYSRSAERTRRVSPRGREVRRKQGVQVVAARKSIAINEHRTPSRTASRRDRQTNRSSGAAYYNAWHGDGQTQINRNQRAPYVQQNCPSTTDRQSSRPSGAAYYYAWHGDGQTQTRAAADDVGHDRGLADGRESPLLSAPQSTAARARVRRFR